MFITAPNDVGICVRGTSVEWRYWCVKTSRIAVFETVCAAHRVMMTSEVLIFVEEFSLAEVIELLAQLWVIREPIAKFFFFLLM